VIRNLKNPKIIAGLVLGLIAMLLNGWNIVLVSASVIYPGLKSIEAIDSQTLDDDKVWLAYWIIFGLFTTAENLFGFLL